MLRLATLGLVAPALLLVIAACGGNDDGGDDSTPDASATSDAVSGDGTPAGTLTPAESPTPTPESPLATPTRVADDEPLMVVNFGDTMLQPTAAELNALPQTEITGTDGDTYEGVTLVDLAAAVGASADGFVEVRGTRSDGVRLQTLRFSVAEVGADTLVVIGESGNVDLVSGSIEPPNWLTALQAVAFISIG